MSFDSPTGLASAGIPIRGESWGCGLRSHRRPEEDSHAPQASSAFRLRRDGGNRVFTAVAGGSAYAAATIGSGDIKNNAVLSKHIKDGAVKKRDLGASSVSSGKVIDHSLLKRDFKPGQLPRGAQGPVGPTFATAFSNPQTPVPPATPDGDVLNGQYSHTFVTPRSGRLLVFASLRHFAVQCSAGYGNGFLYLDGVGVPGSGQVQPDSSPADPFTPVALTGVVPAGKHTLTIALDCPMGNRTGDSSSGDGKLGAVLIGS